MVRLSSAPCLDPFAKFYIMNNSEEQQACWKNDAECCLHRRKGWKIVGCFISSLDNKWENSSI